MSERPRLAPELDKPGLQPERTALAWERTAISMMILGVLLARTGATERHWAITLSGMIQTVIGSAVLIWSGFHYRQLHGRTRDDEVCHPGAARAVGLTTVAFTGAGVAVALRLILA